MRRIYESTALTRDDDDPGTPREREDVSPQSFRSLDADAWSRRLVPARLRRWAISVEVSTPREQFPAGSRVPFTVTMRNALPAPVTVGVRSPRLWTWSVDGHVDAAHVSRHDPPDERTGFEFDRGERKVVRKHWDGMFQVADDEWARADPGEYTIGVALDVADARNAGLADETTVTLSE